MEKLNSIAQLDESVVKSESWIHSKLKFLKTGTLVMVVIVLCFTGILLGYFVLGGFFWNPFRDVAYAYSGGNYLDLSMETPYPARSKVEYGTSEEYLNTLSINNTFEIKHRTRVQGLLPNKPHVFRMVLEDEMGRIHFSNFYNIE